MGLSLAGFLISFATSTALPFVAGRLALGLALSRLSAKGRRGAAQTVQRPFQGQGENTPQSLLMGRKITAGHQMAPDYAHNLNATLATPTPGAGPFVTYLINLSDAPVDGLEGFYLNDTYFDYAAFTNNSNAVYGPTVEPDLEGREQYHNALWVKFYDGTQTEADPYLLSVYGSHPDRPWKATSVHRGAAYAIVTIYNNRAVYQREPEFRFIMRGRQFYNPITGVTEFTENAPLMAWNLLHGIDMPEGDPVGYLAAADRLPSAWWDDAIFAGDQNVEGRDGQQEAQYRAAYEYFMATPDDGGANAQAALDQILDAADAEVADIGGTWIIRVGAPAAPLMTIDLENDKLITEPSSYSPSDSYTETVNAASAVFSDIETIGEPAETDLQQNDDLVLADGEVKPVNLQLQAVPYRSQAERIVAANVRDAQRRATLSFVVPPKLDRLHVFDTVFINSTARGYVNEVFQVIGRSVNHKTGYATYSLRNVDSNDFVPIPADDYSATVPVVVPPTPAPIPPLTLDSVSVSAGLITGGTVPIIDIAWTTSIPDLNGVGWEIFRQGEQVLRGSTADAYEPQNVRLSENLSPQTEYEVYVWPIAGARITQPSGPYVVTTENVRPGLADLDDDFQEFFDDAVAETAASATAAQQARNAAQTARDAAQAGEAGAQAAFASTVGEVRSLLPSTFENDRRDFAGFYGGAPESVGSLGSVWTFANDAEEGRIAVLSDLTTTSVDICMFNGIITLTEGRTYRLTVRARLIGDTSSEDVIALFGRPLNVGSLSYAGGTINFTRFSLTSSWADYTIEVTQGAGDPQIARFGFYRNGDWYTGPGQLQVSRMIWDDITEEVAALGHAQASAGSAATASSEATEAASSAAAAQASFTQAQGEAGRAETEADRSASEAGNSAASAGSASTSASQASGFRDEAEGFSVAAQQRLDAQAQLFSSGVSGNLGFLKPWTAIFPPDYRGISTPGSVTQVAGRYGSAARLSTVANPTSARPVIELRSSDLTNRIMRAQDAATIQVRVEAALISGIWGGAHILVQWRGDNIVNQSLVVRDLVGDDATGTIRNLEAMVERPAHFVPGGANGDYVRVLFYATSAVGTGFAQNIIDVHAFDFREELGGSTAQLVLEARATQESQSALAGLFVEGGGEIALRYLNDPATPVGTQAVITADQFRIQSDAAIHEGGVFKSSTYDEDAQGNPLEGWAWFDDGTAKMVRIITATALDEDAVFENYEVTSLAAQVVNGQTLLLSIPVGDTLLADSWEVGAFAETRLSGLAQLHFVYDIPGFGTNREVFATIGGFGNSFYTPDGIQVTVPGAYLNVRFELWVNGTTGSGNNLRNAALFAFRRARYGQVG